LEAARRAGASAADIGRWALATPTVTLATGARNLRHSRPGRI